jgi:CDP-diglyceride synthetase
MGGFFHNVFQVFFLIGYLLIFVVTIIILRPFRVHHRRMKSTIALKVSYLLYQASFLVFTYLLLFGNKELAENEKPYDTLFNIHFLLFLTATLFPNLGIMIRKGFKKNRIEYNVTFMILNMVYFLYLLYLCLSRKWALL